MRAFRWIATHRLLGATLALGTAATAYFAHPARAQDDVHCYYVVCSRGLCSYVEVACPDKPMEPKPIK